MQLQMRQFTGFICVILAGVGFGFLGIFGRLAFNSGMTVGQLLTFRFSIAAMVLFFGLLIFKKSALKLNFRQILISSCLGVFGYAVFSTLYFKSIQGLSVSLAALLLFTFPLFVNLGSHFILKEKMTLKQLISLLLACAGIAILLWGPVFFDSMFSIIYAVSAAIAYSIYVLVSGKYQQGVDPFSSSLYVIFSAAVALSVFHRVNIFEIFDLNHNQIFYVLGLSVVCTIVPIILFLIGLQHLSSSTASIVVMIEPVVAALAAWIILDEKLRPLQYVGMALVFVALNLNVKLNSKN
jgi:drug/metabolite transporter (DMT)-like permease